jgi:hypothetical protein
MSNPDRVIKITKISPRIWENKINYLKEIFGGYW